mmetsp:Transcript_26422/g.79629  ORF Transcript_26422/g.79629 Transcript_26422/m.79629 type:complete len:322 (-) Transcript_26422:53-1018(-)
MVGLLRRDHRCVAREHEVDARVRHQVRLELRDVDVERAVETKRCSQGGDDLREQAVQVCVRGPLDVEVAAADIVQGFVVHHDGHVRVLEEAVDAQHGVVRLDNRSGHLGASPSREAQLGLFPIVHREALKHQAAKARAGAAAARVEDHEALQARAIVRKLPDAVQDQIDNLLANGVVATREIVRRILLAGDQLLRMEELPVGACAHLVHDRRLQVHENGPWHVLAGARLAEEGVERIVAAANGLVTWHLAIGLDAMLQTEELPTSVADLHACLANVDAEGLTHVGTEVQSVLGGSRQGTKARRSCVARSLPCDEAAPNTHA